MIDEIFWNRELNLFEIPKFQCPECQKGLLLAEENKCIKETTTQSKRLFEVIGEPEYLAENFVAILKCNNPDCGENTVVAGKTKIIWWR